MNVLALFVTLPLIIVAMLFLLAIATVSVSPGRIPVVLQRLQLETLTPNDYSGLTQTPRNLI